MSKFIWHLTTKKILTLIVLIQLALLGLVGLDRLGLKIPILRQIIAFIYLTFVIGFLILGILRLDDVGTIEGFLYSVGMSLFFLMFMGAAINSLYPLIGISKPISETPLIITINVIVLFLCFICYLRNKNYSNSFSINTDEVFSSFVLCLLLLPFLAVFGAYSLNSFDNNLLLLVLLVIVSVIPAFVTFDKISNSKYPFAIWIISISLLLHNSLIGYYVSWGDASAEYITSKLVLTSGFWDNTIQGTTNSLLSITMLHPIYSIICNIELTWVFKITYPLLFSLAPVALYVAFKRQTNDKIAFLSSSFFMFSFNFFTVLSRNTRTGLAILFLAFFALLMADKNISSMKKRLLGVAIILSIGVIYYGVAYMLILFLFPVVLLHFLDKKRDKNRLITQTFASLYVVFAIAWYMHTSHSSGFNMLVGFGENFVNQFTDFLTVPESSPTYYLQKNWSMSLEVVKYLNMVFMFFIAIGITNLIYRLIKGKEISFSKDYSFLSIVFFLFLFATLSPLPGNMQRILQISLVFLAPFSVIGCIWLFNNISKSFKHSLKEKDIFKFFSALLLILLIFSSGFVSATLTHDLNPNELINKKHVIEEGNVEEKEYFYRMHLPYHDIHSSKWLLNNTEGTIETYGRISMHHTLSKTNGIKVYYRRLSLLRDKNRVDSGSYIYLGYCEYRDGLIIEHYPLIIFNTTEIYSALNSTNKIYDNGGNAVYKG